MRKKERKLKLRITILEIENGLLRADIRRFIEQQAVQAHKFSRFSSGELTAEESSFEIAKEVALEAAVKLCHFATTAVDTAAHEISERTLEHVDDVVARLYDCSVEEWEELSSVIRACEGLLEESFEENDEQGFTE